MYQVLIVDDSEINLTLLKALVLRLGGCAPSLCDNPLKALEICTEALPDLLIVDYMMPDMDGLELIRRFRALPDAEDVPILMITANDQKDVRYQALAGGANDFLNKPIDRAEFAARAKNMLALRKGQKMLADRALHLAELVDEKTEVIRKREQELIFCLSRAAEFRDPETGGHIQRMAYYSQLIARSLGLSSDDQKLILEASPMHDVGKIGIPDHILLKPGRLDVDEFGVMKNHAQIGFELLRGTTSDVLNTASEIAGSHHEKWDGSGYPNGLSGEDIPLFGRIVAVADVFDALTSERVYKPAWSLEKAKAFLIEGRNAHFDAKCVDAFMAVWDDAMVIRERFKDEAQH
jgi:response regulator RpfG family c-di-GMP phosphodiesterase